MTLAQLVSEDLLNFMVFFLSRVIIRGTLFLQNRDALPLSDGRIIVGGPICIVQGIFIWPLFRAMTSLARRLLCRNRVV